MHGRRIQDWRRYRGLTQEQLAERASLSLSSVQRAEGGVEVRFSALLLIAEALSVSIGPLLSSAPGDV